ncbi:O-antigen ligase family protein [Candidatus Gottesmanbacteria bacterium]|nr:O-antigen ligase family protein [Candidatus Gottesmanbacteria bacterium]
MKKLLHWSKQNFFLLSAIVCSVFIPLYPKLPLVDIKNTWVYIRIEDFLVVGVLFLLVIAVMRRQISLKTPLTMPILLFWIAGGIATMHGILLVFPSLQAVYPNVAFLSFLRRMEYMSLFFVGYFALKEKRHLAALVVVLVGTVLAVSLYGIGQKYLGFPAFLTMNEEYAKGIPIRLSQLSRISSTFSGHYDLAAYLVLVLPVFVSLLFGYTKYWQRAVLILGVLLGFIALFMTVSRISFFALLLALGFVVFLHKRKLILLTLPVTVIFVLLFVSISPRVFDRFGNTVKAIDVVIDAKTGDPIGHTKTVPNTYFMTKIIKQQYARTIKNIYGFASPSASFVVPYLVLPEQVVLLAEPDAPTGEDLPQGTGYINLSLAPVIRKLDNFFYEPKPRTATTAAEVFIINGDFLLKKVFTYDLSFTTRFQGEWPRAMAAFTRNILVGSGYGSVGLAVDNSYLRMLAEVGSLGFVFFTGIFVALGMYIKKIWPDIDSEQSKSFIIGVMAGLAGIGVNALFIDVFEASKVAFMTWLLIGMALGLAASYQRKAFNMLKEFKRILISMPSIAVFIFLLIMLLYSPLMRNNFVGDDFTWFRWVADCGEQNISGSCPVNISTVVRFFTHSDGFFYRPGTKIYFLVMYTVFWLNQNAYHAVSLALHGLVALLVFILANKLMKQSFMAAAAGLLFLFLSGYSEAVHWISATGFLFSAVFILVSLLSFINWVEKKKMRYGIFSIGAIFFALSFHEVGVVTPFVVLAYRSIFLRGYPLSKMLVDRVSAFVFFPLPLYFLVRFAAGSHWLSGDYNYNVLRLPFNVVGNAFGYFLLTVFGSVTSPLYQLIRGGLRTHIGIAAVVILCILLLAIWTIRNKYHIVQQQDRSLIGFGLIFSFLTLLPFLGLGNISSRYSYVASVGVAFTLVIFMKYVYILLRENGTAIAKAGTVVIISVYMLFQIIQQQQITADWYQAGEKTRRFIVSMGSAYEDSWAIAPVELHFVNVPIRHGEAWVFPVGMPDAVWLIYRNPNIRVFSWATLPEAFSVIDAGVKTQRVFEFDASGKVVERIKPPDIQ